MNQVQESINSSYKSLDNLFTEHEATIATLPGNASGLRTTFGTNCVLFDSHASRQSVNKSGLRDNKLALCDLVISDALDLSKRVSAFAVIEGNVTLLKAAKLTETELRRLPDTKLVPKIMALVNLVPEHATGLLTYGVTPVLITNINKNLSDYAAAVPQPKLGITETKQSTLGLNAVIKENSEILKKFDALFELIRMDNPALYNSYKTLRRVVIFGKSSLAMKVMVQDANTGAGVPKVKYTIEKTTEDGKAHSGGSELQKNVKLTADSGGSNVKNLPEGKYTLTFSKLGYITQVVEVNVIAGERCDVMVQLVAE
jgi:hypothetical protein